MAGETVITVVGNLTADPELRTIANGSAVASFTIASTPRTFNRNSNQFEDGPALFMRCSAWRDMAEHCANTLSKGMRVIAQGRLSQRSYQAQDGSNRSVIELTIDEIGPSLRYATAQVTRQSSATGFAGASRAAGNANGSGNGGYHGGSSYAGGANYANNQAQSASAASAAPAADPWSASAPTNDSFASFGATSDFGGSDEPEF
ncbi:single-stranded DNA-binding protein [Gardnerella sp. 2492-Sm]|uniref:single-stranded DNA-binding protein n=1 Tax=unclassified Gardnerella TaxID=2628112 RepID=UPI003D029B91